LYLQFRTYLRLIKKMLYLLLRMFQWSFFPRKIALFKNTFQFTLSKRTKCFEKICFRSRKRASVNSSSDKSKYHFCFDKKDQRINSDKNLSILRKRTKETYARTFLRTHLLDGQKNSPILRETLREGGRFKK
jgi:hypothetical protein